MSFNKDAEIEWLETKIVPKLLKQRKIIENFEENDIESFEILNVGINLVGAEEAFMLTTCYRAALEYQFKGVSGRVNFFVKKTPALPQEIFDSIHFSALFSNEIIAYEQLFPALQAFSQIDLKIAKFYYADLGSNYATVIIEDFTNKEWSVAKAMVNISLEHILLGVKYLAEFHAIGFAWRHLKRQQFDELTRLLKEARYNSDVHANWDLIQKQSQKRALSAARKYQPSVDEMFLEKLGNLLQDPNDYAIKRVRAREPLITLCHGDYLRNNVAYRYNKDGRPFDVTMFDLQTLRTSSPMVDLSTFLSLSTYAEVRYKHFEEIFTLYSETLKKTYNGLVPGATLPEYLSHNSLLQEYIKFLPHSLSICAAFLMNLVEPRGDISELMATDKSEEETIQDVMSRGGEEVDRELAHQIRELYELSAANAVNVFEELPQA